jgi:hypothetical protein
MEENYTIDEILTAVDEIQSKKKEKKLKVNEIQPQKKQISDIPLNTLKLIEEAEKIKN